MGGGSAESIEGADEPTAPRPRTRLIAVSSVFAPVLGPCCTPRTTCSAPGSASAASTGVMPSPVVSPRPVVSS